MKHNAHNIRDPGVIVTLDRGSHISAGIGC
jgi:hypothetical protein